MWGSWLRFDGQAKSARRPGKSPPRDGRPSRIHGSDRVLACSSDGGRCTRRSAKSSTCDVNASDAPPTFWRTALGEKPQGALCRTADPQKLTHSRVTCGCQLEDACSTAGPMSVKILHFKMRQTLSAVGMMGMRTTPIQVCAALNTYALAPTNPPTLKQMPREPA
jgi:hypothetical protein